MSILNRLFHDSWRLLALIGGVVFLLLLDTWAPSASGRAELSPLLTSTALVLAVAAMSHLTRRIFFPKLDLQEIARTAMKESNTAAAIVFFAVCLVLSVLIYANVAMLK